MPAVPKVKPGELTLAQIREANIAAKTTKQPRPFCEHCGVRLAGHRRFCSMRCHAEARRLDLRAVYAANVTPAGADECWDWAGRTGEFGYGEVCISQPKKYRVRAHRLSWEIHRGPIPHGLCVLHKCDRPVCVNPDHLFLGTRTDNNADRQRKGRTPRGESTASAKLSEADVTSVREMAAHGFRARAISTHLELSVSAVRGILEQDTWSHVAGPTAQRRHHKRLQRDRAERSHKADVRARDVSCRWPGCETPADYFWGAPEVAHVNHKGAGGDPLLLRSKVEGLLLMCRWHHRGPRGLHSGLAKMVLLTEAGTAGPVEFYQMLKGEAGVWVLVGVSEPPKQIVESLHTY